MEETDTPSFFGLPSPRSLAASFHQGRPMGGVSFLFPMCGLWQSSADLQPVTLQQRTLLLRAQCQEGACDRCLGCSSFGKILLRLLKYHCEQRGAGTGPLGEQGF